MRSVHALLVPLPGDAVLQASGALRKQLDREKLAAEPLLAVLRPDHSGGDAAAGRVQLSLRCSAVVDATSPTATNSAGLHGTVGEDGALASLGIHFARPGALSAPTQPQQPYNAAQDAVSLTFLRQFYDQHVKPLDGVEGGHMTTTDSVAKTLIMRHTWDTRDGTGRGRARRYAEILEPKQLWPGPESGTDMCVPAKSVASDSPPCFLNPRPGIDSPFRRFFISHAFLNPFCLLLEVLESHFRAAGAMFENVYVWLDGAPCHVCAACLITRLRRPLRWAQFSPSTRLTRASTLMSAACCR